MQKVLCGRLPTGKCLGSPRTLGGGGREGIQESLPELGFEGEIAKVPVKMLGVPRQEGKRGAEGKPGMVRMVQYQLASLCTHCVICEGSSQTAHPLCSVWNSLSHLETLSSLSLCGSFQVLSLCEVCCLISFVG